MTESDDDRYFSPVRRKLVNGDMAGDGGITSEGAASAPEESSKKDNDKDSPALDGKLCNTLYVTDLFRHPSPVGIRETRGRRDGREGVGRRKGSLPL